MVFLEVVVCVFFLRIRVVFCVCVCVQREGGARPGSGVEMYYNRTKCHPRTYEVVDAAFLR